ncbi:YybH family protein [Planctomycetota bacterium]
MNLRIMNVVSSIMLSILMVCSTGCQSQQVEMDLLLQAMDVYETAWSEGDFLTVESFFAEDAKRLHTEPYVWDRQEIKRYFEERAAQLAANPQPVEKKDWKKERDYLEIRVEGNIAYDIFTTSAFKALHIWEKQKDGSWKIIYDMGMLNYPEPP